jgi:hypothetical protein
MAEPWWVCADAGEPNQRRRCRPSDAVLVLDRLQRLPRFLPVEAPFAQPQKHDAPCTPISVADPKAIENREMAWGTDLKAPRHLCRSLSDDSNTHKQLRLCQDNEAPDPSSAPIFLRRLPWRKYGTNERRHGCAESVEAVVHTPSCYSGQFDRDPHTLMIFCLVRIDGNQP